MWITFEVFFSSELWIKKGGMEEIDKKQFDIANEHRYNTLDYSIKLVVDWMNSKTDTRRCLQI